MSWARWSPGVVQHPWDPMVGIPTPPERGYDQLSYAGLNCSYARHREYSHPMCGFVFNCICADMYYHLIHELSLAICLGVEGSGFGDLSM
jgi:hypothetical protein